MAGQQVNMVDAVATEIPRMARARSAVLRLGTVVGAPVTNPNNNRYLVPVVVGDVATGVIGAGKIFAGFDSDYWPQIGDSVVLANDRDMWVVLYRLASSTIGGPGYVLFNMNSLSGNNLPLNANAYQLFTKNWGYDVWTVRTADVSYLDCKVPGLYDLVAFQRVQCPNPRSTGYAQAIVTGSIGFDIVAAQGGSPYIDLNLKCYPVMCGTSSSIRFNVNNATGANVTIQAAWLAFTRIGDFH
jgi:hypothetical protein